MKGFTICVVLLILAAISPKNLYAQHCEYHQAQVQRYTDLRRKGGTAKQMDHWQKTRNHHKREYDKCTRSIHSNSTNPITVTQGNKVHRSYADRQAERPVNTHNETLRKLIETCNYWIREHNRQPSEPTLVNRNTACKAVDNSHTIRDRPQHVEHIRTLDECIKPDNLIDNDVADCMQGNRLPDWLH